jgi:hypothetical protein
MKYIQKWGNKSTSIMNSLKLVKKGRLKLRPVSFSGQVLHSLREIEQSLATWTMDMWWGLFFQKNTKYRVSQRLVPTFDYNSHFSDFPIKKILFAILTQMV